MTGARIEIAKIQNVNAQNFRRRLELNRIIDKKIYKVIF